MGFFSDLWNAIWHPTRVSPDVNAALQRVALYLKPTEPITMSYDSSKTVELLGLVLTTLKTSRATSAEALAREKAALAAIEPLRGENSRLNTAITQLQANVAAYEANDAAEDAALKAVVDFIESGEETPVEDPTPEIPGLEDGTPSTPPTPPAEPPVVDPPAPPVVEPPAEDPLNEENL
jgi:hypothetical protein